MEYNFKTFKIHNSSVDENIDSGARLTELELEFCHIFAMLPWLSYLNTWAYNDFNNTVTFSSSTCED